MKPLKLSSLALAGAVSLFPVCALAADAGAAPAAPKQEEPKVVPQTPALLTWSEGLSTPESVLVDGELYLVSNINGAPLAKDNNGYIARLKPDGTVADAKWIEGGKKGVTLNAPKGMGIFKGVLYVADIDTVRLFDAKTGKPKGEVAISGASFLNDIAIDPKGKVYVSDSGLDAAFKSTGTDAVYVLEGKKAKALAKGELSHPNGLLADAAGVHVVAFGGPELYTLSKKGEKEELTVLPKGGLDGIVAVGGGEVIVSSWDGSALYRGKQGGTFKEIATGLKAPADLGYDAKRKVVLVPRFMDNRVEAFTAE
jgi:hypothetical protein